MVVWWMAAATPWSQLPPPPPPASVVRLPTGAWCAPDSRHAAGAAAARQVHPGSGDAAGGRDVGRRHALQVAVTVDHHGGRPAKTVAPDAGRVAPPRPVARLGDVVGEGEVFADDV